MPIIAEAEAIDDFAPFGIRAFTTARCSGSFGLGTAEPVREVMSRWAELRRELAPGASRLATAAQVHGNDIVVHDGAWEGWLRTGEADGHVATQRGIALAVTVADCVPVFLAHPSGAIAALHSGWRGTASRIIERGIMHLAHRGIPIAELRMHLGPSICGSCYEVSPEVYAQLTGRDPGRKATIDLRGIIAAHARDAGVRHVTISDRCTRCHNDRFFSHRAGDEGRQLGVISSDR